VTRQDLIDLEAGRRGSGDRGVAECVADELLSAGLTNDQLRVIVGLDSGDDAVAQRAHADAQTACAGR
jgi:hypothetical protein